MMMAAFSWNWSLDGWIVVVGSLCALSAAVLGNFLVLRKMSMLGDAITPGLAVADVTITPAEPLATQDLSIAVDGILSGTVFETDAATPVVSEPPRPRVVMLLSSSTPWKPATMTTRPSARSLLIRSCSIDLMRALL